MVFVEVSDAAGHNFEPSFEFVSVEVDEESAVREVVGRNGAEKIGIVVVFVISVDRSPVQPGEVIDHFQNQFIAGVDLVHNLAHRAGGVLGVAETGFQDIQNIFRLRGDIGHAPFVPAIELQFYSIFVYFIDIVEVGLPVFVVDVGDGLELLLIGAGEVDISIDGRVDFHLPEEVLVGGFEIFQPLHHVFLDYEQSVEHLVGGYV